MSKREGIDLQPASKTAAPKILFVDDESGVLKALARVCRRFHWDACFAESGREGLDFIRDHEFDVVVSDMRMPVMAGAEFLHRVKIIAPTTSRLLFSGYSDVSSLETAINDGEIMGFLTKPWDDDQLKDLISKALHQRQVILKQIAKQAEFSKQKRKIGIVALTLEEQLRHARQDTQALKNENDLLRENVDICNKNIFLVLKHILINEVPEPFKPDEFVATGVEYLAKAISMSEKRLKDVVQAGWLHRLGEICQPIGLRDKSFYDMSGEEKKRYQMQGVEADQMLSTFSGTEKVRKMIKYQFERLDGSGFPEGLDCRNFSRDLQLLGLVRDTYWLYHGKIDMQVFGFDALVKYLKGQRGKLYNDTLVDAWLGLLKEEKILFDTLNIIGADHLVEGMIPVVDVYSSIDTLLVTKNTPITEAILEKLCTHEAHYDEKFRFVLNPIYAHG